MIRRLALLLVVVTGLLVGCSLEQALPHPDCDDGGSGLIVAQSVPTAELVPCLGPLPNGWSVESVTVDQGGSSVRLDSDRAGGDAARLLYGQDCPIDGAVSVPTDQRGAQTFEFIERIESGFRADLTYVFDGGCVRWEFDFDPGASATLSIELRDTLTLIPRATLNDNIRETFIDEEL